MVHSLPEHSGHAKSILAWSSFCTIFSHTHHGRYFLIYRVYKSFLPAHVFRNILHEKHRTDEKKQNDFALHAVVNFTMFCSYTCSFKEYSDGVKI